MNRTFKLDKISTHESIKVYNSIINNINHRNRKIYVH